MREELRRSNSVGNTEGIDQFLFLIFKQRITSIDALSHACRFLLSHQLNLHLALMLFEDLELLSTTNGYITIHHKGESLMDSSIYENKKQIAKVIINKMLDEDHISLPRVIIDNTTGILKIPINAIRLEATIYATFLQAINCLRRVGPFFIFCDNHIRDDFEKKTAQRRRIISHSELLQNLQKQQEDGDIGEQFVIDYEKRRLTNHSLLPRRISSIDVSAGYDILSCNSLTSDTYDRYIEVKAFRGSPHFYWSENERSVAALLGDNYFIYLVNLQYTSDPLYSPTVIQNPANNILTSGWLIKPQSYLVQQI